jgi:hypothetical protein
MAQHGRWLSEQGSADESRDAFRAGLQLCPLDPEVACQEKLPPELPEAAELVPVCQAARKMLQD